MPSKIKGIRPAMPRGKGKTAIVTSSGLSSANGLVNNAKKPKKTRGKPHGGYCCPALHLAVSRAHQDMRTGIQVGTMFGANGKRASVRQAVVIYFPKAKKTDESEYGWKSKFKDTSYGLCKFCPFCGAKLEKGAKYPAERIAEAEAEIQKTLADAAAVDAMKAAATDPLDAPEARD